MRLPDVMFKLRSRLGSRKSASSTPALAGEGVSMKETFCGSMSSMDGVGMAVWRTLGPTKTGEAARADPFVLLRCGVTGVRDPGRTDVTVGVFLCCCCCSVSTVGRTAPRCTSGNESVCFAGAGDRDAVTTGSAATSFECSLNGAL